MGFFRTTSADLKRILSSAYMEEKYRREMAVRESRYNAACSEVLGYAYQMQTELFGLLSVAVISKYLMPINNRYEIIPAGYMLKAGHILLAFKVRKSDINVVPREELNRIERRINMLLRQQCRMQRQAELVEQALYYAPLTYRGMCVGYFKDSREFVTFCVASNGEPSPEIIQNLRR